MIAVSKPKIAKNAKRYVLDCLSTGWISSQGQYISQFEQSFAKYLGVNFAITTTSGTAALHLALTAAEIGQGDEVIVPSFNIISPVFAIIYTGAKPVLVDSEPDGWNMDVTQVAKKITRKTRAIMAVHLYGQPVNLGPLLKIARKHGLVLIEDAAESLGAQYQDKKVGSFGDMSCFSFYANKLITTGEGGMVVTKNPQLNKRLRLLKDMAYSPKKRFLHTEVAFTYRMSNLQAALGLAQLEEIEKILRKKRVVAKLYDFYLKHLPGLKLPTEKKGTKSTFLMYGVLVEDQFGISRDVLTKNLYQMGIETRDFFVPIHRQPALKNLGLFKGEHYPVTDNLSKKGFYLPSGPDISQKQLQYICETIKSIYEL